jgi:hypothetical protein
MNFKKTIFLVFLISTVAMLAGCNAPAPTAAPAPTVDVAAIKEEIYKTVVAQLTLDAPKATPTEAATSTEAATATVAASPTAAEALPTMTAPVSITLAPKATFTAASSYTSYPTWTVTPYVDRAQLSFQNPADGLVMARGQAFDVKWVIKNIGRRNWNDQFYVTYLSGVKSSSFTTKMLSPLNIGDETTILADFVAPSRPGNYVSQWALINDDSIKIFRFNYVFSVK